jgi:DNA-directed RNA polymerase subunit K/omega
VQFSEKLTDFQEERRYKYLLVNVIAKRARAVNDGARPEVAMRADNPLDLTRVALAELKADKLRVEPSERAGQLVDIAGIVK